MSVKYGNQIGVKFTGQGKVKRYCGNTIVSKVDSDNPSYHILEEIVCKYKDSYFDNNFIFLPSNSYHLTLLRGLNDQVRTKKFWPSDLDEEAHMKIADEYIASCVLAVTPPYQIQLKFDKIAFDNQDLRVCFKPKDEREMRRIKQYRDALAKKIGLKLPGHEDYTLHITLAYTWHLPNNEEKEKLDEVLVQSNIEISQYADVILPKPLMTYYDDMLNFYTQKIPR